jgi:AcrR family transcriptional regulator
LRSEPTGDQPRAPRRGVETTALILRAALDIGTEVGFDALTVELLAERTGIAKTTIYRRWPNISTVVMDAFLAEVDRAAPILELATARESLTVSMKSLAQLYRGPYGSTLRVLIGRAQVDSELRNAVVTRWVEPRRAVARSIISQGIRSQEIRDLDPDLILDALYGPIYHRLLVPYQDIELSDAYVENLVDTIFNGVAPT